MTGRLIPATEVIDASAAAGIIAADQAAHCQRLVLDLRAGHVPVLHLQLAGDERALEVVATLEGVKVFRAEPVAGDILSLRAPR